MTPEEKEAIYKRAGEIYDAMLNCVKDEDNTNAMFLALSSLSSTVLFTHLLIADRGTGPEQQQTVLVKFAQQVDAGLQRLADIKARGDKAGDPVTIST